MAWRGRRELPPVAMPLYYFHVYNTDVTMDREGQELADDAAARVVALGAARELMCEEVRHGTLSLSHWIEVENEQNQPLYPSRRAARHQARLIRPEAWEGFRWPPTDSTFFRPPS